MAATASLTLVKAFTYRGAPEEWSNTYHLDNVPPDTPSWSALADLVLSLERAIWTAYTKGVRAIGHEPTNPVAIFEKDYSGAPSTQTEGLFVPTAGATTPGDCACWIRWSTTQLSSRGKPIWLRSYFHDVWAEGGPNRDTFVADQKARFQSYGNEWANGMATITHGTYRRAGPNGAVAQVASTSEWITTRTLEKRGRRRRKLPPGTTVTYPPLVVPGPVQIN